MRVLFEAENYRVIEDEDGKKILLNIPSFTKEEIDFIDKVKNNAIKQLSAKSMGTIKTSSERKEILRLIVEELEQGNYSHLSIDEKKAETMVEHIVREMHGYGYLDLLLENDELEEIMVIGERLPVFVVHRKFGMCETNLVYTRREEIEKIIKKIAGKCGRTIDMANPLLDARLRDGSRVNATLAPISLDGPTLTIRKFKKEAFSILDLLKFNTLNSELAAFLWLAVDGLGGKASNIIIAGGTGSGKTTTLNVLCSFIPPEDRVITIEDTAELKLPVKHKIRLETRLPNPEGRGGIDFNQLLINTLRMRPDRIILGEVRGEEAETLFVAMNTGHEGCMGTLHANTALETITRLTNPPMNVPPIMIPALDIIVMQNRVTRKGRTLRRVSEVAEVAGMEMDRVLLNKIYEYVPDKDEVVPTGTPPLLYNKISEKTGLDKDEIRAEKERRKLLLDFLIYKNIHRFVEVHTWIKKYYRNPEKTMKEVEELLKPQYSSL